MKNLIIVAMAIVAILFSSCSSRETVDLPTVSDYKLETAATPKRHLKIGVVPGVYSDMFTEAIQPSLEDMGYTVEMIYYDNYALPNLALSRNRVDLNMHQHYQSLNAYVFRNDLALSAIAEVPTPSMGIFSLKYDSLQDIEKGATVSIPIDDTNLSRALCILEDARLIQLDPNTDRRKASQADITYSPHNLTIQPLEAQDLMQSLETCELSVIDGNYALAGGMSLDDSLHTERMDPEHLIVIAVLTEDLLEPFVMDIVRVTRSERYREVILNEQGKFAKFQRPFNFFDNLE